MARKPAADFSPEEMEAIERALAQMEATFEAARTEAQNLSDTAEAEPVESGNRWWTAYTQMELELIAQVRSVMDALGMNQAALAQALGVSTARVSQILAGENENFKLQTLAKLATALNRDVKISLIKKNEEVQVHEVRPVVVVRQELFQAPGTQLPERPSAWLTAYRNVETKTPRASEPAVTVSFSSEQSPQDRRWHQ